jgi:hypothetical protein
MLHSDPPDGFRRRASLTEPGRSILLCHDPFLGVINFGLFSELTGIGNEGLMASRMCPLPIPINGARPATPTVFSHPIQGRQQALHYPGRRVAGIRADAMWHPFLWLPPRLANRQSFQVDDSGGVTRITRRSNNINPNLKVFTESDDVWVIRVVLEVSASGLYDMESGTWLDILSMLDIDTMTDDGVDRVQRWLDGAEDADLDLLDTGLELEHHVTNDDNPNWALQSAVSLSPELRSCVWATGADSLLGMLDGMTDEIGCGATLDVEDAKFVASTVALLGSTWMGDLDRSSGHPHGDLESTWWNEIAKEIHDFEGGLGELVIGGLVDRLSDRLIEIREMFWPTVQPPSAHA